MVLIQNQESLSTESRSSHQSSSKSTSVSTMPQDTNNKGSKDHQNGHAPTAEHMNGNGIYQHDVNNSTLNASVPPFAPPSHQLVAPPPTPQFYNQQYYVTQVLPHEAYNPTEVHDSSQTSHGHHMPAMPYDVNHPGAGYSSTAYPPIVPGAAIHPSVPLGHASAAQMYAPALYHQYIPQYDPSAYYNHEGAEEDADGNAKRWTSPSAPSTPTQSYPQGESYIKPGVMGHHPTPVSAGYPAKNMRANTTAPHIMNTPMVQVQNSYVNLSLHNPQYSFATGVMGPPSQPPSAATYHPNSNSVVAATSAYDPHHIRASSEHSDHRRTNNYSSSSSGRGRGNPNAGGRGHPMNNVNRRGRRSESERQSFSSDHGEERSAYPMHQKVPYMYHQSNADKLRGAPYFMGTPQPGHPIYPTFELPNNYIQSQMHMRLPLYPNPAHMMLPTVPPPHQQIVSHMPPPYTIENNVGNHYEENNVVIPSSTNNSEYNGNTVVNNEGTNSNFSNGELNRDQSVNNNKYEVGDNCSHSEFENSVPRNDVSDSVANSVKSVNMCDTVPNIDAMVDGNVKSEKFESVAAVETDREMTPVQNMDIYSPCDGSSIRSAPSQENVDSLISNVGSPNPKNIICVSDDELQANWDFPFTFGDILSDDVLQDLNNYKNGVDVLHTSQVVANDFKRQEVIKPVFDSQFPSTEYSFLSEEDVALIKGIKLEDPVPSSPKQKINVVIREEKSPIDTSASKPITKSTKTKVIVPENFQEVNSTTDVKVAAPMDAPLPVHKEKRVDAVVEKAVKVTEKPPVAPVLKKTFTPSVVSPPPPPQEANSVSAWGKQKNWSDAFNRKKVATVAPFSYNGELQADQLSESSEVLNFPPGLTVVAQSCGDKMMGGSELPMVHAGDMKRVADFVSSYSPSFNSPILQPRGLTNKQYWCYVNSVLQAFVAIPQFVNFFSTLDEKLSSINPQSVPYLYSMLTFFRKLSVMNPSSLNQTPRTTKHNNANTVHLPEIHLGDPFEPTSMQKVLLESKNFQEGCQHDAEEMLSYVLNSFHDEILECFKLVEDRRKPVAVPLTNGHTEDDGDEWVTKGPKKTSCITRTTKVDESPISKIFWGVTRSVVKKGNGTPTANLEPFITLPLDIQDEKITSVKDALEQCLSKADVAGYTCNDTQQELSVSNHRLLEELPEVLILQLKRFIYHETGGLQKVTKDINVSIDLDITKDLMSPQVKKKYSAEKSRYKLVSIVYHDGKDANKGHYISDVYHSGYKCWLNYDDACVKAITSAEMHSSNGSRVPYLLFYRREDTFHDGNFPVKPPGGRKKHKRTVSNEKKPVAEEANKKPVAEEKAEAAAVEVKPVTDKKKEASNKTPQTNANNNNNKNKKQDNKKNKRNNNNTKN